MQDELDQQIREEFKSRGIPIDDEWLAQIREQYESHMALQRLFEPVSPSEDTFEINDQVELIRPFFKIPVGAIGTIKTIETLYHKNGEPKEESELSPEFFKGRPYLVMFNLEPFQMPFEPHVYEAIKRHCKVEGIEDIPKFYKQLGANVSPHDIRKVNTNVFPF